MKYPTLILMSAVLSLPAAAAQYQQPSAGQPKAIPQEQTRTAAAQASAKAFFTKAAHGNKAEMELAGLVQQKSKDDRVKAFADQLMKDHQQADGELRTVAKTKNIDLPTDMPSEAVATKTRLSKLEGAAFDRAYVDEMVKDHTQDVKEFEQAAKSSDADVKSFAEKTLPTLRDHLQRAQELKRTLAGTGK
jgi:putative membrane protein